MNITERLKIFIDELEQKQIIQYLAFIIGLLLFLFGLILYFHTSKVLQLQKEFRRVNHQRIQARNLLEKHTAVKQQKIEVDTILLQDKTFKIKEYFSSILKEMNLQNKLSKDPEVAIPQDLDNGYTEIKLDVGFTNMNMKELAEIIYNIEKNRRIYTKELVITKALQTPTIDVTLIIATLQPKIES